LSLSRTPETRKEFHTEARPTTPEEEEKACFFHQDRTIPRKVHGVNVQVLDRTRPVLAI
jgi:hypothetical protein